MNIRKILSFFILLIVLLMPLAPQLVSAAALVPCGGTGQARCELADIFQLILNIYNFLILVIATPLAGLMIVIGGVLILLSGINANWFNTGKKILMWSFISLLLIFGSWLIIN